MNSRKPVKDLSPKKNAYPLLKNLRKTKPHRGILLMLLGISCNPLKECLTGAYHGEMSISQKRGVISMLPKKNKDTLLLKNWRPITLLNIDYKIATKCIAKRLEKVLTELINRDQTGYVTNPAAAALYWRKHSADF